MAKMSNKLIALCSAAIGTIYLAGYAVTGHTQGVINNSNNLAISNNNSLNQINTGQTDNSSGQTYQDGTYIGTGSNNIGSVQVAVTIKNDRIENVQITSSRTHYPQSYINGLPNQVIQRQSENIDFVSGATKSSQDFKMAVHQALLQAKLGSTSQAIAHSIGLLSSQKITSSGA